MVAEDLIEAAGTLAVDAEMVLIGVATTPSMQDQITIILHKETTVMGLSAMDLAEEEGTSLEVSMVVVHLPAGVEVQIKILTQGRHISRKVRQLLRMAIRETMDLEVGMEMFRIRETIPVETNHMAIVIDMVMVAIHKMEMPHTGATVVIIHTVGMVDTETIPARVGMVDMVGMGRVITASHIRPEGHSMAVHGVEEGSGNNWSFYCVGRII